MDRPVLVLWFALALFAVLGAWGIYHLVTKDAPNATIQPSTGATTQPLVERLKEERERRLREQGRPPPVTQPSTAL